MKKLKLSLILLLVLYSLLSSLLRISIVKASGTIYIRADGWVYPSDAPIHRDGNLYTLTGNVNDSIVVQRENIVLDGVGLYTVGGVGDWNSTGIDLTGRNNVTVMNIKEIKAFGYGLLLNKSSNIVVSRNTVTANKRRGVYLGNSSHNTIFGNNLTANWNYDLELRYSSNNTIYENNATRIKLGSGSTYNSVYRNQIVENGISVDGNNNLVYENNITNCYTDGLQVYESHNNIFRNNITGCGRYGIYLWWYASFNTINNNNVINNTIGIYLDRADENTIFHNNFLENEHNAWASEAQLNLWDAGYPSGGNYWSNYTGVDEKSGPNKDQPGSDGIGDSQHIIDPENFDNYPLMGPIDFFNAGTWNETDYFVDIVSNSTVSDFNFNPAEGAFIKFNVTSEAEKGFCRVTIPKDLLWVEDGQWSILVGSESVNYTIIQDENYTYLYFTFTSTTKTVLIQGTDAIPEFPTYTMFYSLILMSFALLLAKKKQFRKSKT